MYNKWSFLLFELIDFVTNALFERPNSHIIFYISKNNY